MQDVDFAHAKRFFKDVEINNLGRYHDLHVESNLFLKWGVNSRILGQYASLYNEI